MERKTTIPHLTMKENLIIVEALQTLSETNEHLLTTLSYDGDDALLRKKLENERQDIKDLILKFIGEF